MWFRKSKPAPDLNAAVEKFSKDISDLRDQLLLINQHAAAVEGYLVKSQEALLDMTEKAEKATERVFISNNAETSRYIELKKRLDKYDTTFQQLGILIAQQKVAPVPPTAPPTPES